MYSTLLLLSLVVVTWLHLVHGELSETANGILRNLKLTRLEPNVTSVEGGNFNGARSRGKWTWDENYRLVTAHGHRWCKLQRDNWSCVGDRYAKILSQTPAYDPSLTLAALPRGTRVFAEGNSYFAQHLGPIICNTEGVQVK